MTTAAVDIPVWPFQEQVAEILGVDAGNLSRCADQEKLGEWVRGRRYFDAHAFMTLAVRRRIPLYRAASGLLGYLDDSMPDDDKYQARRREVLDELERVRTQLATSRALIDQLGDVLPASLRARLLEHLQQDGGDVPDIHGA